MSIVVRLGLAAIVISVGVYDARAVELSKGDIVALMTGAKITTSQRNGYSVAFDLQAGGDMGAAFETRGGTKHDVGRWWAAPGKVCLQAEYLFRAKKLCRKVIKAGGEIRLKGRGSAWAYEK